MISRIPFVWFAACVLVGCGSSTPEPSGESAGTQAATASSRQKGEGFSLEVPPGWKVFAPPGTFSLYPEGGSGDASMAISLVQSPPDMNPESYLADRKVNAPLQTGTIETAEVTVGGLPAVKHVHAYDPAKSAAADRINFEVAAPKGSYKIFCTVTKPDEFSKYQAIFEQVVQSIRFE